MAAGGATAGAETGAAGTNDDVGACDGGGTGTDGGATAVGGASKLLPPKRLPVVEEYREPPGSRPVAGGGELAGGWANASEPRLSATRAAGS